jgi:hypothetical protein
MNDKQLTSQDFKYSNKEWKFAECLFLGHSQYESWGLAGYSTKYDRAIIDSNASNLANSSKIQVRLAELRQAALTPKIMDKTEILERLSDLSRANLTDFQDPEGNITLSKDVPHHAAAKEYKTSTTEDLLGKKRTNKSIKLSDPIAAIQEINKMLGNYAPTKHVHANVNFNVSFGEKPKNRDSDIDMIETSD